MKVKKLVRLQIQLHIILANVLRHYRGKIKQNNFQNVSFIMTSVAYDFLIGLTVTCPGRNWIGFRRRLHKNLCAGQSLAQLLD